MVWRSTTFRVPFDLCYITRMEDLTTHASFLTRLKAADMTSTWRELHQRYGELIRGFARRRHLQPSDCDDVAQDVWTSLVKALPDFEYDPAKGKFRSYLKTATLRAIIKKCQQGHGEVNIDNIEDATRIAENDAVIEEAWELEWRQYHLGQAMRTIEAEFSLVDRKAFQRYAVEGREPRETAEELGLSIDQVYQAKSRIMHRIKALIDIQIAEEG